MVGPFSRQNLQQTASHTKCLPHFHVGTLNGGTILTPEPSGNCLLQKAASHTKCPPDFHVGTLNGGTILTPEIPGKRLPDGMPPRFSRWNLEWRNRSHARTLRKQPPARNASQISRWNLEWRDHSHARTFRKPPPT